jgi:integrase/recombinase XerD
MKTIICERVIHDSGNRVALRFPYDVDLISVVKSIPDAKWSDGKRYWNIPDNKDVIKLLLGLFKGKAYINYSAIYPTLAERVRLEREKRPADRRKGASANKEHPLSEKGLADIARYKKWMEANRYPESTVKTYTAMMATFLRFVSPKEASECDADDLVRIVDEYILPEGLSNSYQNQMISAVKKFYGALYRSVIDPGDLTRPRPQHRLPNVLSKEEVKAILNAPVNEKHRVMLSLIYACGLRRSELIELIPEDIESERGLLRIRQSKGNKDRVVPISEKTVSIIRSYISRYRPQRFVFEGQWPGKRYSASSLEKVLKNASRKAGIMKEVSLHWLRHSYATHLLESGTDLRYIQELLGHRSSKTTEIYTHVTMKSIQRIRSPFDDL